MLAFVEITTDRNQARADSKRANEAEEAAKGALQTAQEERVSIVAPLKSSVAKNSAARPWASRPSSGLNIRRLAAGGTGSGSPPSA